MPKNNDAILLFWNGHSFRISVTSLEIQNPDSISTHFSDFLAGDQKELYTRPGFSRSLHFECMRIT